MKNQLTHYTRFIPATSIQNSIVKWFRLGLWANMTILLIANMFLRLESPPTVHIPTTFFDHMIYARALWESGYPNQAVTELASFNQTTATNVLGDTTNDASPINTWKNEQKALSAQYAYWESITEEYPNYRDGCLALARLAYMLNKPDEVKINLQKAEHLDPNGFNLRSFEALQTH